MHTLFLVEGDNIHNTWNFRTQQIVDVIIILYC